MFSERLDWHIGENELWLELNRIKKDGQPFVDLTESNPTLVGLNYSEEFVSSLNSDVPLIYKPTPFGCDAARDAISRYYQERDREIPPENIVITASTSEAYSFLFKLLCNSGDEVLIPKPSYPLFDFLALLENVTPSAYPIDIGPNSNISSRTRAIITVHPNNPTGEFLSEARKKNLFALCERHDIPLIIDEVFLDYAIENPAFSSSVKTINNCLVFTLSGLSKVAGLPQVKLAWIALSGSSIKVREAIKRLEYIADTYLSVGSQVQLSVPHILKNVSPIQKAILARIQENQAALQQITSAFPAVATLRPEGGWYGNLKLPALQSSEEWALDFLREGRVYTHPGLFFGFSQESHCILSLIVPPEKFRQGIKQILQVVLNRLG